MFLKSTQALSRTWIRGQVWKRRAWSGFRAGWEPRRRRPGHGMCGEKWEGLESIWRSSQQEGLRVR